MGVMSAGKARTRGSARAAQVAQGLAIWFCGVIAVAIAATYVARLALAGWSGLVAAYSAPAGFDLTRALVASAYILGIAFPIAVVIAFLAALGAYDRTFGGQTSAWLAVSLRVAPVTPAIAVAAAGLWVGSSATAAGWFAAHAFVVAALALAVLNVPMLTLRLLGAICAVPDRWRVAAIAAGASPHAAVLEVVLPRALQATLAVLLGTLGQMFGETTVVTTILGHAGSTFLPLCFDLWRRLTQPAFASTSNAALATETLLLVTIIVAFRFAGRLLQRRRKGALA